MSLQFTGPLNELAERINATATAHGFWPQDGRNFGEMLMLATSELAEAMEEHRAGKPNIYIVHEKPEGVAVEIVDCIIRCLDTLHSLDVDIDGIMALKMTYNDFRPHLHGKAY